MQRRQFLATAAAAQRILGANDRVRVALIGCGGRGRYVARLMREAPGCEFVAACDVYQKNADLAAAWMGNGAPAVQQFERILDNKDVDAVLIATPDHWHAIPAVLACAAGKDVYVEKPLGHNVREGRMIVAAGKKYNRVVQTGMQHRSAPHYAEVQQMVQSGEVGEVHYVRVWNYSNMLPNGIGRVPDSEPPEGLDWDRYLGPAPKVPFNQKRFLMTYRYFRDYAGGTITDFGIHRMDTVHQVMGRDTPRTISASGGRFALKDSGDQPDLLQVTYEYPGFVMTYEACNISAHGMGGRTPGMQYYNARSQEDRPNGEAYYGSKGALFCDRIGWEVYPDLEPGGTGQFRTKRQWKNSTDATGLHAKNFIECVRSRSKPNADAEVGHRSTLVAHLGNIAYYTGKKLHWDGDKEQFLDAPDANAMLFRKPRGPWDKVLV